MLAIPPLSEIPLVQGLLMPLLLRKLKGYDQMLAELVKSGKRKGHTESLK
jgi:hypothetical protein